MLDGTCCGKCAGTFFPCKVAEGGDEGYLVCAVGASSLVLMFFLVPPRCRATCSYKSHCTGCMKVAWNVFWGGCRRPEHCDFLCKVAEGGDEGQLVCRAVQAVGFDVFFTSRNLMVVSRCFGCVRVCVVIRLVESVVADHLVIAA